MFVCEFCSRSFSRKDVLKRHGDCRFKVLICSQCNGGFFKSEGALQRHMTEKHRASKRKAETPLSSMSKKAKPDLQEPSTSGVKRCEVCALDIPTSRYPGHLRTLQHRSRCAVVQEEGVELIRTSFRNRLATYRLPGTSDPTNVKRFLEHLKPRTIKLVGECVRTFAHIKVGMELFGRFILQTKETAEVKSFLPKFQLVSESSDLDELFDQLSNILDKKVTEFKEKESGWALQQLLHLELSVNKYNPAKASSYIPLPKEIERKKAVLNIQNTDEKCFMWSVLAALHPVHRTQNANRVAHYVPFENELDFTGIDYSPMKLKDIHKFEQLNDISINVYGLDRAFENGRNITEVVGPLYFTKSRKPTHINLLVISDDLGNSHFCLIRSLSRLISSQLSKEEHAKYLCDGCLIYFSKESLLVEHQKNDCNHVSARCPTTELRKDKYGKDVPENILKFENFDKKLKVPFVVYADFETIAEPIEREENELDPEISYTIRTHKHIPYSFAYYIKCCFDDSLSLFKTYRGLSASEKFIEYLENDCKRLYSNSLKITTPMTPLSVEQEREFNMAPACHICEKPFNVEDERVRDHCHLTGNFRGASHSICNLNFKVPKFIPIFFHNMSGFDSHLMIRQLATEEEKLDVIAQNKERYISFTKHVLVDNIEVEDGKQQKVYLKLRFLDSFRFMASGLDKLSQNLKSEQCREVRKYFPVEEEFQLIRQKGVFPYSYVSSFSKLDDIKLPSHEDFYNDLKKENISVEEYERALNVWNLFKCETLGQYSDIYLKSDVLLLADIFENFRNVCIDVYGLDPAQYYTAPGLSWDSALKHTGIKLELLTDIDMVHFLKQGIRGGVAQCSVRKAFANSKFTPDYDASKPTSYIMYLDATNLYGAAMSQYLPTSNFKWLDEDKIQNLEVRNLDKDSNIGYILECDIEYPENLHHLHNELPFCPQSIEAPKSKSKITKLIPNFLNKSKYIIHFQNLRQALEHGLKLIKIHRILSFDQSPWLKSNIDMNTAMRNKAQNKFEKDFFKLMNNAVFGKTMENVEKRVDVKLVTHWENVGRRLGAEALLAKPHCKNFKIFSENLVAIQMQKQKVVYNKPIYVGFSILDISKTIMYEFLYGYIKPKYGNKAVLLYTDTDSLILQIYTENFYDDMRENLNKFDTSNYSQDNQHNVPVNSSVLGRMKDEYAGKIIWEFYGTGAKAYCVNVEGNVTKKAKGVSDYVTKKELSIDDYKLAVNVAGTKIHREMSTFHSHLHDMYVELKNKVALSYADDKRYIIPDSEFTLSWGHRDLALYEENIGE